jgi:short subunit dehydrogenase-like uncharacterized protein
MHSGMLIYGANGYTGELIARTAAERGLRPIVAGRNRAAIEALAARHGFEARTFGLGDAQALDAGLRGVRLVLHCAGPFAHTAQPMAEACLRAGAHYLDITGEVAVFEALAERDAQARSAGVMLLPGAGFDVVPSDCLAAHLKRRLPGAHELTLGFQMLGGGVSWGTATTMVENLHQPSMARRAGRLVPLAPAAPRKIDFGSGPASALPIVWGDLATAYRSTGIPNITVYSALARLPRAMMRLSGLAGGLLTSAPAQRLLKRLIRTQPPGPSDSARARGQSLLWGEALDTGGARCVSRLRTPEAYTLTALTALAIAERALDGDAPAGFQTPALAYGPDFILEFPGVTREDL